MEKLRPERQSEIPATKFIHTNGFYIVHRRRRRQIISDHSARHAGHASMVQTGHRIHEAENNYEFRFHQPAGLFGSIELQFDTHVCAVVQRPVERVFV